MAGFNLTISVGDVAPAGSALEDEEEEEEKQPAHNNWSGCPVF